MRNEFTAVFERDGDWWIAYCPEIPGANGLGKTKQEARQSLADAISLILQDRREDGLRGVPPAATSSEKDAPTLSGRTPLLARLRRFRDTPRSPIFWRERFAETFRSRNRESRGWISNLAMNLPAASH